MRLIPRLLGLVAVALLLAAGPARALDPENTLYMDLPLSLIHI